MEENTNVIYKVECSHFYDTNDTSCYFSKLNVSDEEKRDYLDNLITITDSRKHFECLYFENFNDALRHINNLVWDIKDVVLSGVSFHEFEDMYEMAMDNKERD